jgi:transcriptional regulator with XRE-family HTH domain
MTKKNLGKKIQTLRKERGVSTYKLRKEGIHAHTPNTIEQGTKNYTIDVLIEYLDACGLELDVKVKST